ncbi:MAG: hypothetical protein JST16_09775 [Bdellovibrionales bacterium]|nr:hypothetical protein [Bdellovibrionales bacterium]
MSRYGLVLSFFGLAVLANARAASMDWLTCSAGPALGEIHFKIESFFEDGKPDRISLAIHAPTGRAVSVFEHNETVNAQGTLDEWGHLELVFRGAHSAEQDGGISNAAFVVLNKNFAGKVSGKISVNGSVYPQLNCQIIE